MGKLLPAIFLLFAFSCIAQTDPGCQLANAFLGALAGKGSGTIACNPPKAAVPLPANAPDQTAFAEQVGEFILPFNRPVNISRIVQAVRTKFSLLDPATARPEDIPSCEAELSLVPQAYRQRPDFVLLLQSCQVGTVSELPDWNRKQRQWTEGRRVQEMEAEKKERRLAEEQQAKKDAAEERNIIADLRAGKRKPINCKSAIVAKGLDPDSQKADVMTVAYQPPTGLGLFIGVVQQMSADMLVLSGSLPTKYNPFGIIPAKHMVVMTGTSTMTFNPEGIKVGEVVAGYASQTGSRNVTLTSGQATTIPVLKSVCLQPAQ